MKYKTTISISILFLLMAGITMIPSVRAETGPRTPDQLIHMYANPDAEFMALETGEIDVVDWPLDKDWIDRWKDNPDIEMRDYTEMAWNELTPNHQLWPFGWRDYSTDAEKTIACGGQLHKYDPNNQRDVDAKAFRKAVAYLNDKDKFIADVLKGLGFRTEASVPYPAFMEWTDFPSLEAKGLVYHYDKAKAVNLLDTHGFVDLTGDGWRDYDADKSGTWTAGDEELPPIEFWARLDDPNRGDSADLLLSEMTAVKIRVNYHKELALPNYMHVMFGAAGDVNDPGTWESTGWPVAYDWLPYNKWMPGMKRFHLYTSGWIATTAAMDGQYDLYHPDYATEAPGEFSLNYGGFNVGDGNEGTADDDWDYCLISQRIKFEVMPKPQMKEIVLKSEEVAADFVCTTPWFSLMSVKAYRTDWEGFVNHITLGVDVAASNRYTFLNCYNPADSTLDWGFKTEPFTLNTIAQQWLYEANVLEQIYEPLISHTPYDITAEYPWLAEATGTGPDGVYGSPEHPEAYFDDEWYIPGTWAGGMTQTWRLREGITFHNGDPVTPEDARWGYQFRKDCGPGVSFEYPSMVFIDHSDTQAQDPTLGPRDLKVYLSVASNWAFYWVGYTDVLNKNIWRAANDRYGWGYDFDNNQPGPDWDPIRVSAYHPDVDDGNNNGIPDLKEDGSGPWVFENWVHGQTITMSAYTGASPGYHKTQTEITEFVTMAFHKAGNVNYDGSVNEDVYLGEPTWGTDGVIDLLDVMFIGWAVGVTTGGTHGVGWDLYNADCNYDYDDDVDVWDYFKVCKNYGLKMG